MKTPLLSELFFFRIAFSVVILFSATGCKKNEFSENDAKIETLKNNALEEKETYFFSAIANLSKKIISKSQIAQQRTVQNKVKELSIQLEQEQNNVFQKINKIATKKLIIITEVNTTGNDDLYELMNTEDWNFDKQYLSEVANAIAEEIELVRNIRKETKDSIVLRLANEVIPQQYKLLGEIKKLEIEIN